MSGDFVCLVEGKSDEAMLRAIIPEITEIPPEKIRVISFDGKSNLESNIRKKLAGYQVPKSVFLVMCDMDDDNCKQLKNGLLENVAKNKRTKTKIRIACHALESFYLGDVPAVLRGLGLPRLAKPLKNQIRETPDNHPRPVETLKEITGNQYQKISGSQSIAPHLDLRGGNNSKSFNALLGAIKDLSEILNRG